MSYIKRDGYNEELLKNLKIDCEKCFGLCCVALYFSKCEGFPVDKVAGEPCLNLQSDFRCKIHQELRQKGLKGCMAYDCFGAGQKVVQVTYKGARQGGTSKVSNQMYEVFLIMKQLHEMMWYLMLAINFEGTQSIEAKLQEMLVITEDITNHQPKYLLQFDVDGHREKVNVLLREACRLEANTIKDKPSEVFTANGPLIGKNLRKTNLIGANLSGGLLIASDLRGNNLTGANLIGADMRDANIRGANLEKSLFVTQAQMNTAKGDAYTRLPKELVRPSSWEK